MDVEINVFIFEEASSGSMGALMEDVADGTSVQLGHWQRLVDMPMPPREGEVVDLWGGNEVMLERGVVMPVVDTVTWSPDFQLAEVFVHADVTVLDLDWDDTLGAAGYEKVEDE